MSRTLGVGLSLVALMLTLVLSTDRWGLGANEQGDPAWPMLLEDESDRVAYQLRGRWLPSGGVPYLEEYSEYPQLTTWAMGLPYLTFEHGVPSGEPFGSEARVRALFEQLGASPVALESCLSELRSKTYRREADGGPGPVSRRWGTRVAALSPDHSADETVAVVDAAWRARSAWMEEVERNRDPYRVRHQVFMALLLVALLAVTASNLRTLGAAPEWALLLLLPAGLYFAFSRFDLLVTVVVALAFGAHLRGRVWWAAGLLGVAIMTKWYPVVLVPLFLSHDLHAARARSLARGEAFAWGRGVLRHVIAPGLVTTAVVAIVLSITWFWGDGGFEAVRFLFDYHRNERVPNYSSLLSALTDPERLAWLPRNDEGVRTLFTLLQLAPGFVLACLPLRSRDAFLHACLAATLSAVLFSKFFSPQWICWGTAVAVLLAPRHRLLLIMLVLLELLAYLQLPVSHYHGAATGDRGLYYVVNAVRMTALVASWLLVVGLTIRRAFADRGVTARPG